MAETPDLSANDTIKYLEVDGPVDEEKTLIRYDVPYAPDDPKKTNKLRMKMGLPPETRQVDKNVRAVIDSFIAPRTWVEGGVQWVQRASPYPVARIDVVTTRDKLHAMVAAQGGRPTGVCPIRTFLYGECFIEVIRQTVAESWESGLLMLKIHAERVMSQKAHREMFESRTGFAFRLALKGEKDTASMVAKIEQLKKKQAQLIKEEAIWKKKCDEFGDSSDEQWALDEKRRNDEIKALNKEAAQKKTQLEALTAQIPKQA